MLRSMFSAVTGLRNHQTYMDVIGNNIANVNTTAFKASRVTFQDLLSQSVRGGSVPQGNRGGSNPVQIGLGTALAAVDAVPTQGALQSTGKNTDLAIQGNGYFILDDGVRRFYTRDGAFDLGLDGMLVSPANGLRVQGWSADDGVVDATQPIENIHIPMGGGLLGRATATMKVTGNLDATGAGQNATIGIYDSLGVQHNVQLAFVKTSANNWTWQPTVAASDTTVTSVTPAAATAISFTADGQFVAGAAANTIALKFNNGSSDLDVTLDLSKLTQLAGQGEVGGSADGMAAGTLTSFTVGGDGVITGVYSNGLTRQLGMVALANFLNPGGLSKVGGNLSIQSPNSGAPSVGVAQNGSLGEISAGFLEMSNVDLAQQFTNMIMAERGFQANSRIITASDEMLQDLVNLKR